ncbi:hypothetical protein SAMN06298221_10662 [Sphaerochaeta associata]|uniref:Uncharacterized protein n=1 Tax=Sphaerochaeta associata TaxID=1129264 RepID=A0ABY4DBP1_9SPIR|nr:hypothetical protein [Sphaerochaeta associata]UOM51694.1 hypothetical protein MUG09_02745 [Sphaerochaeta associata]SMP52275.1 hypothetical protein SAMN06298221_10662 [Sphaerochaeta associata]
MQYLTYALQQGGIINRFLVSETHTQPVRGEAVVIQKEANVWEGSVGAATHVNPVRETFVQQRRQAIESYPTFIEKQAGGSVLIDGTAHQLSARFPFNDPVLSLSGFYPNPTWISATAITYLDSQKQRDVGCVLSVCGGARIWVNENLVASFTPHLRNQMQQTHIVLPLKVGENEVVVFWDEFAERDSDCSFSLSLDSDCEGLVQKLPIGECDAALVLAVEEALGNLSCRSNHVRKGEVELFCPNPYEHQTLEIHLIGATEENFMVGDLYETTAVILPGKNTCSLGPCEKLPIGYLQFKATAVVQGMSMSYHLAFENFPLSLVPQAKATMDERKQQAFEVLARYGERNANRAVAILHADGPRDEFEHILRRQITFINKRSDCSDFYLSYFPHILRTFADHPYVTEDLKEEMKHCLLNFRYWHDEPGDDAMWFYSENHALMFHVCQLLAGELYPDEVFTNSGMTGARMQEKAVGLLRPWFETFFAIGFTEWNSPPYLPIDALGFASLYAQTSNQEMKDLARKAMDSIYYILAINSLDGIFCTTAGRTYPKELFGNNSNCPSFINWIGYGIGNTSHAGKGVTALCFSDYQAPQEYRQFCQVPKGKALISQSTHGYNGHADVYVCKTSCSLLSSANNFRVGERGFQENPIHLIFSATEQVWINHPGEHNLFGHARPSYWAGNGTLPRVNQYENFACVVFNNDPAHPVDFTHVYLPTMEFASFERRGSWLFAASHNGGYVGVYCSQYLEPAGYGPNKEREFIAAGRKAVYLLRVGSQCSFGSFASFIKAMLDSDLSATDQAFVFEDPSLGRLEGGWDASLEVQGQTIKYNNFDPVGTNLWYVER